LPAEWSERDILGELEKDLGGAELSAVLSEWITTIIHRIMAVTLALGWWRTQMIAQGYSPEAVEANLPMIMDRLWSVPRPDFPLDQIIEIMSMRFDEVQDMNDDETDGD
jgi:hypothetical protein